MRLIQAGISHQQTDVAARERFALADDAVERALEKLAERGVEEAFILATCQRTEVTVLTGDPTLDPFVELFGEAGRIAPHALRFDDDAVHHLFRVASGLDSAAVGEPQIQGQVAGALRTARGRGLASGRLGRTVERALHVARKVRVESGLTGVAQSLTGTSVDIARGIFEDLGAVRVLILGAGEIGMRMARKLRPEVRCIKVLSRTLESAQGLSELATPGTLDELGTALPEADIVVTALKDTPSIISSEMLLAARRERLGRPILLLDLAVPRNVDPAIASAAGAFLYDLDDLRRVLAQRREECREVVERAEAAVACEAEKVAARERERDVTPLVVALQNKLDALRAAEVKRFASRLPAEELERVTRGLTGKILHELFTSLKEAARAGRADELADATEILFGLGRA
ncbi:MAG: glutamyl-tRNA reductase [Acidobacteriota bacterium]